MDAAAQGKTLSAASTATFIVGMAGLGTGIVLVGLGWSTNGEASPTVSLQAAPVVAGAGLVLRGRF